MLSAFARSLLIVAACSPLAACVVVPRQPQNPPPAAAPVAAPAATPAPTAAVDPPPPPQPTYVETPQPPEQPADAPKGGGEGRPPGLHRGAADGIWVWHDDAGWHVRTTTARKLHRFSGRVWGNRGEVGNVQLTHTEWKDRFRKQGNWMTFDFHTQGDEDGFDFQISESDCALFNLFIDGKPAPSRIFVGARAVNPSSGHFRVCK